MSARDTASPAETPESGRPRRPSGLREAKKRRTRERILEAALALFRERGYDEARVQDIIARVGISEGTFFNYFPTKEALLHDFALVQVELYREALRYETEEPETSVPDRIRHVMRAVAMTVAEDRDFQAIVYTRSDLFSSRGVLKERTLLMYEQLTELFRLGQRRGEVRADVDAVQLAEILTGIHHLTTLNWLIGWWGASGAFEPRLMRAVDLFLEGCKPAAARDPSGSG
jgi:AcrR family transcriptional regulator